MYELIPKILLRGAIVPVLVAAIVGAVRYRHLPPALRCLAWLAWYTLSMEVFTRALGLFYQSNLFMTSLDTALEFGLLAAVYRQALRPSALSRWLPVVAGIFMLVSLLSYLRPAGVAQFNPGQRFAESLLVLALVLAYFLKVIRELLVVRLERDPMFWVSAGLLLYFAGSVFVFLSSNYVLRHSNTLSLRLWAVHAGLYMVLYGLYSLALWMKPSRPK